MLLSNLKTNVVVPFDFSDMSFEGIKRVIEMVEDPSSIRLIHVTEYPSAYVYGVAWENISNEEIIERIQRSFNKKIQERGDLPNLELMVVFGSPGYEIARFADATKAEMIVMPSHGRTGVTRLLLGSVAERVLRLANCPVLILKNQEIGQFDEKSETATASSS